MPMCCCLELLLDSDLAVSQNTDFLILVSKYWAQINNLCVHTDLVQQGLVSSSKPSSAILANDVVGPLLLEVSLLHYYTAASLLCYC